VECLSVGRCITLPSSSAGGVKSLALATGAYARIRRQFKLPIGKMEGIEEMLAIIGGNAYMMDAVTSVTTKALDLGEKPSVISAICKYHLTEKMRESVNASMDVHGGKGIMLGPNNYLGRDYQGAPIAITVEGANILTRNMMIYGQGAMRCHPWVLKEIEAVALPDADAQLDAFDSALFGHIGFTLSNLFSCVWSNLSGGRFHATPFQDETSRYYRSLSRHSASLALMSDVSMGVLGGNLKRMERLSARLGDILSYLYLSSCTLKRFEDEGRQQSDLPLLHWAMQDNLYKLETAIVSFLDNFPNKSVAIALKVLVMPWGRSYKRPSDKIEHTISQILQTTSETRTRLGEGQYLTREPGNISGDLEQVLDDILACEPLHQQICQAADEALPFMYLDQLADTGLKLGVIDQSQAELMRRAEAGRLRVINVDDFTQEELELGHRQSDIEPQANSVAA
jgi:acyl-CoA dehydrogenase